MARFANDPQLSAQLDTLPPKALTVEGVQRRRNRDVEPDEAARLAERGLRSFVVSWKLAFEVSAAQLREVLAANADQFGEMGPGHPPEASVYVYGRRDPKRREDTRIVVACIGGLAFDEDQLGG